MQRFASRCAVWNPTSPRRSGRRKRRALALKELPDHTLREQLRSAMIVDIGRENASLRSQLSAAEAEVGRLTTAHLEAADERDLRRGERDESREQLQAAREAMGKVHEALEAANNRLDEAVSMHGGGSVNHAFHGENLDRWLSTVTLFTQPALVKALAAFREVKLTETDSQWDVRWSRLNDPDADYNECGKLDARTALARLIFAIRDSGPIVIHDVKLTEVGNG